MARHPLPLHHPQIPGARARRQVYSSAQVPDRACVVLTGEVAVQCVDAVEAAASGSSEESDGPVAELLPAVAAVAADLGTDAPGVEDAVRLAEGGIEKDVAEDEGVVAGTAVVDAQADAATDVAHVDAEDAASNWDHRHDRPPPGS